MTSLARVRQAGQATVEHVGIVAAITLLFTSLGLWASRNIQLPDSPPAAIDYAAKPLGGLPAPGAVVGVANPPWVWPQGRDDEPIGRALRRARDAAGLVGSSFVDGFNRRLAERLEGLVDDPVGAVIATYEDARENPTVYEMLRRQIGDVSDYVGSLRGLSAADVARKVAHDLGELAAEIAVVRGTGLAGRVADRLRSRGASSAEPSPRAPPPPPTP